MEIVKNYRDQKELRDSFNELAGKVFSLSFEAWYRNGFWKDNYNPYSVVIDGKVVSNVSVNRCDMVYDGKRLHLIQLGTVMTDPDYRGRGYAGLLMNEIMKDYEDKVDGIYLFANDSVLDFYPGFGFVKGTEYKFSRQVSNDGNDITENISMNKASDWEKMVEIMKSKKQYGNMILSGNEGLFMFYLSQFMQENVFYIAASDTYVVAEKSGDAGDNLILHAIFGSGDLNEVIEAFGSSIKSVELMFTPINKEGFTKSENKEEDTTLFTKGHIFEELNGCEYIFQAISHA